MTTQPIPLSEVDVIGYADVLPEGNGPAVVPPVFRHRTETDHCYVPPFRVAGNWLVDPKCISFSELQDLAKDEAVTLPKDFKHPARADCQLWVDENGTAHYEPLSDAKRNLHRIHGEHLGAAVSALHEGRFENARQLAGVALAANDRAMEPRALIAALHALRGETAQISFLKKADEQAGSNGDSFLLAFKNYLETIPAEIWERSDVDIERVVETCKNAGVEVWIPFQFTEEDFLRFRPILHEFRRAGNESTFTVSCPGVEAILMAERQTLRVMCTREEEWIKIVEQTRVLTAVAKTMLYEPAESAALCLRDPKQVFILGERLRMQIRPLSAQAA